MIKNNIYNNYDRNVNTPIPFYFQNMHCGTPKGIQMDVEDYVIILSSLT